MALRPLRAPPKPLAQGSVPMLQLKQSKLHIQMSLLARKDNSVHATLFLCMHSIDA
jgi:hypothetical protein